MIGRILSGDKYQPIKRFEIYSRLIYAKNLFIGFLVPHFSWQKQRTLLILLTLSEHSSCLKPSTNMI